MWWRLVIDCPHKIFDTLEAKHLHLDEWIWVTYTLTMCYPNYNCFENCSNFHIHERRRKIVFSLEFVCLHEKNKPCCYSS